MRCDKIMRRQPIWTGIVMCIMIAAQQLLQTSNPVAYAAEIDSLPRNLELTHDDEEENTFIADYLADQAEYDIEPDPPFLGGERNTVDFSCRSAVQ